MQRTALDEFWCGAHLANPGLPEQFEHWQHFYNHHRSHSSLGGQTPREG